MGSSINNGGMASAASAAVATNGGERNRRYGYGQATAAMTWRRHQRISLWKE